MHYANTSNSHRNKLIVLNNKILWIIQNKPIWISVIDLCRKLHMLPCPTQTIFSNYSTIKLIKKFTVTTLNLQTVYTWRDLTHCVEQDVLYLKLAKNRIIYVKKSKQSKTYSFKMQLKNTFRNSVIMLC